LNHSSHSTPRNDVTKEQHNILVVTLLQHYMVASFMKYRLNIPNLKIQDVLKTETPVCFLRQDLAL
jgi:hypothetical protein